MITYELGKRKIRIPDEDINKYMKNHGLTQDEAIQVWLEDEGYLENEEQEILETKAKENRITATIHEAGDKVKRKRSTPRTVKVSDEKQQLFNEITETLEVSGLEFEILKENKLIQVKIGEKIFKIDVIEQRTKKNGGE
jgi:hypothetical protein